MSTGPKRPNIGKALRAIRRARHDIGSVALAMRQCSADQVKLILACDQLNRAALWLDPPPHKLTEPQKPPGAEGT